MITGQLQFCEVTFRSSNEPVVIPPNDRKYIGVRLTLGTGTLSGSTGTITYVVTITPGTGGGESPISNNGICATLTKI